MGHGDEIIATGLAKGLAGQGKRAAFGNGKRIFWGPYAVEIFRYNPNIAPPGSEGKENLVWIDHYKGSRRYNSYDKANRRWIWNYDFKVTPGEIYFRDMKPPPKGDFIYIEPNLPWWKIQSVNKDWGTKNYQEVATRLRKAGYDVVQSDHGKVRLTGARTVATPTFRHALALLSSARTALLPEGGMHHGAAAVGVPAVVIFGGFIPPSVVGYDLHINLTGGSEACGLLYKCQHCRDALARISVEEVYEHLVNAHRTRYEMAG